MADNEVEFIQMLGRKRLNEADENINLFIFTGTKSEFGKKTAIYYNLSRKLQEYQKLPYKKVIDLLLKEELELDDIRKYYTEENQKEYQRSDLSFKAIQLRYIFCKDMNEKLKQDSNAFIREQFTWLNIPFPQTEKELLSYYVTYSQEEISQIVMELENILNPECGIISSDKFKSFADQLMNLAPKIDPNLKFKGIQINTINQVLKTVSDFSKYEFTSFSLDKITYYELKKNHESKIKIKDISKEDFEMIMSKYTTVSDEFFKKITDSPVPSCFSENDHIKQSFLSAKMKENKTFQDYTIKHSSNKLILSKRAQK